jgi:hypothetical protein
MAEEESSNDSSYVLEEPDDEDEKESGKRRKVEPEVQLLKEEELDDLWAEMNAAPAKPKVPPPQPRAATSVVAGKKVAPVAAAAAAPVVDVSSLLAELDSGKPSVEKEVVRFAGQEVEVTVAAKKKQAVAAAAKTESSGLDNLLDSLRPKAAKKINTVQKSEIDWESHKHTDKGVQEELETHMKGQTYLDKVSFLKRAELREYELEREGKRK